MTITTEKLTVSDRATIAVNSQFSTFRYLTGRSSFIATKRGGVIADPTQPLISDDAVIADWIILSPESKNVSATLYLPQHLRSSTARYRVLP